MTNKKKVIAFLKSMETSANGSQQNPAKVNVVRAFEDGDYVFTHTEYLLSVPKTGFDVFRFNNGKIIERWDNLQDTPATPNPSGHTLTDGSTEIKDLDKTAENKKMIMQFAKDILVEKNVDKLSTYINGEAYIQHNPHFADGISGLLKGLGYLASQGLEMNYKKIFLVLGEGNFVLVVGEGNFGENHTIYYDLFRVENGKIMEHWDVVENMLSKEKRKKDNG